MKWILEYCCRIFLRVVLRLFSTYICKEPCCLSIVFDRTGGMRKFLALPLSLGAFNIPFWQPHPRGNLNSTKVPAPEPSETKKKKRIWKDIYAAMEFSFCKSVMCCRFFTLFTALYMICVTYRSTWDKKGPYPYTSLPRIGSLLCGIVGNRRNRGR